MTASPTPLGATPVKGGTNFAVWSHHAERVEVCLFENGRERRIALPEREGDVHFGFVSDVGVGARYGLRAHGPYRPREGHRFNAHKLLLDPYARALDGRLVWDDAVMGYRVGHPDADLSFSDTDSAPFVPRCVVTAPPAPRQLSLGEPHPQTPWNETLIYEAHARGLTMLHPHVPEAACGTFDGLAAPAMVEHLRALGVTAIELLPVHAFVDDRFLDRLGLRNHWGYQTIGFFAPQPRYGDERAFRRAVDALHAAGIEVLLDVVYNHSGEADELGPTLSFRGLDNASYYRLAKDRRYYVNDTGTGNAFAAERLPVRRLVLDSLRHWRRLGVDGFRFDLATTLGRTGKGFRPDHPLLDAVRTDPELAGAKLIAEPWDVGTGGYRLGRFPAPWREWNDRARDGIRRFWRGDAGQAPELARRVAGSAGEFDHGHRAATSSINFVAAHDGFTLHDATAYLHKRNHANGEGNRDGHEPNHSTNGGHEGATDDPAVLARRRRTRRNLLATLMLCQGVPMWLAGDEASNGQNGNNNAFAQDNPTGWTDWSALDTPEGREDLLFYRHLACLRREHPVLRQRRFLHSATRADGRRDLVWWHERGREMEDADWNDPERRLLAAELRRAADAPDTEPDERLLVAFNAGPACAFTLPPGTWRTLLDTGEGLPQEVEDPPQAAGGSIALAAGSVLLLSGTDA